MLSAFIRVHPWPIVLFLLAGAQAAQLSHPAATAPPGASLVVPVTYASQSALATGLQFDLQHDSSALTISATLGATPRLSGKSLYLWDLAPGRRRFLLIGLNREPLADGALINLFVNLSPTALQATYPLKFLNATATDAAGLAVIVKAADCAISIQGTADSGTRLPTEGIVNAASLLPGPVAPGEIISLLGAALNDASVLFDGVPAPLLYSAPNQINAIAPFGLYKKTSTQLQVMQRGQPIADLRLSVADAAPAIFTLDGSGIGPGAILNQDSSLNSPSLPAANGSVIVIFATGAGQTDPPGVDGQITGNILPKPLLDVTVQIGGLDAKVLYAGAAPGLVAGLLQVNCVVPPDAPSGYAVPILLTVGKVTGPAGVTLAVQ